MAAQKTKKELQEQIRRLQQELKEATKHKPPPLNEIDRVYFWLGQAVLKTRNERLFTQGDLAARLNFTRTSVVNLEQGRQRAPLHIWMQAADILNIRFVELLELAKALEADYLERVGQ